MQKNRTPKYRSFRPSTVTTSKPSPSPATPETSKFLGLTRNQLFLYGGIAAALVVLAAGLAYRRHQLNKNHENKNMTTDAPPASTNTDEQEASLDVSKTEAAYRTESKPPQDDSANLPRTTTDEHGFHMVEDNPQQGLPPGVSSTDHDDSVKLSLDKDAADEAEAERLKAQQQQQKAAAERAEAQKSASADQSNISLKGVANFLGGFFISQQQTKPQEQATPPTAPRPGGSTV